MQPFGWDSVPLELIGSDQYYKNVRNLVLLAGRFLDASDLEQRARVCLLTEKLAYKLYGSQSGAIGQTLKIYGLRFTVVGVFKERVESFGQSEVSKESVLLPITVLKYFTDIERIDPMYVQVKSANDVEAVTRVVREILESRHRPGAKYTVENLTEILNMAKVSASFWKSC